MSLERVKLFDTPSFIYFLFSIFFLLFISLTLEYNSFSKLKKFDDAEIEVKVISQYLKTKNSKTYTVLKLRAFGKNIYTTISKDIKNIRGRTLKLRIWTKKLNFLDYLKGFYIYSAILHVSPNLALKERVYTSISSQHKHIFLKELYGALFTATPMSYELREKLSALGISHLFAISGFHLGVFSIIIMWIFSLPYKFFQERYFPYRSRYTDMFFIVIFMMLIYISFLGSIASLIRAFVMMIIGFMFYDRHIKIISLETLFVSVMIILALYPGLFFNLGFCLSVMGVFYIFLFLKYFSSLSKIKIVVGISIWVYIMMLPISLYLFHTFSLFHPLSIILSISFLPVYIISLLLHVIGEGGLFDSAVLYIFKEVESKTVNISAMVLLLHVSLSFLAVFFKRAFFLSFIIGVFILIYAISYICFF